MTRRERLAELKTRLDGAMSLYIWKLILFDLLTIVEEQEAELENHARDHVPSTTNEVFP